MKNNLFDSEKFFSQLSHDLRGSFTSILGFSNILSDPDENLSEGEVKEFGKRITAQANDSLELLVNFIDWLKLEKYNSLLNVEKIKLSEAVSDIINSNRNILESAHLSPIIDLDDSNYVLIDYEILTSILNNIILYLVKFAEEGTELRFSSANRNENITHNISVSSSIDKIDTLKKVNFTDPNSENAYPIIFAFKFVELCGGEWKFSFNNEDFYLQLSFPLKQI